VDGVLWDAAGECIDLTASRDEAAASDGAGGPRPEQMMPPESAIKEVRSVLESLNREAAIALLQRHHNHAEDAIMASFAE